MVIIEKEVELVGSKGSKKAIGLFDIFYLNGYRFIYAHLIPQDEEKNRR